MGKGLSLDIGMNTREVVRGSADIEKALDGVGDTLDELARDGDQAADKLEASFKDVLRDISKESARASRSVKQDFDGTRRAGADSMRELKAEGLQNISETLSSTDGSIASFADGVQGTMGGLIGGLSAVNPVAAGVAGAAALSFALVTDQLVRQEEQAKQLRIKLAAMYSDAVKAGRDYIDQATIIAAAQDIIQNPERLEERNRAEADALKLKIDTNTVILAQAGDQESLNTVLAAAAELQADYNERMKDATTGERLAADKSAEEAVVKNLVDRYGDLAAAHEVAGENARHASEIAAEAQALERDQIDRTAAAEQARLEGLAAAAGRPIPPIKPTIDFSTADKQLAAWRARFTTGDGVRITINADVVDRLNGRAP